MGLTSIVDIKNPNQQLARINTDLQNSVFIGGGKSDAARIVGQEFADITGGTRINNNELVPLLQALLNSNRRTAPGLVGVEIASLSSESFTLAINGNAGSLNYIEFSGGAARAAIDTVLFTLGNGNFGLDLKNANSQVTLFNTDLTQSIFVGSAAQTDSQEIRDIIGGSSLSVAEVSNLFAASVSGRASNGTSGVEGVDLISLTDRGFTLQIGASGNSVDTIIVEGSGAISAIASADAARGVDLKDGFTAFDVFNVAVETNEFIGGTSGELNSIVGGAGISRAEVLPLFDAIISGNGRNGNTQGIPNVELIGLNDTSFAIEITSSGGNEDSILFTNVDLLPGAAAFGFGDGPGATLV